MCVEFDYVFLFNKFSVVHIGRMIFNDNASKVFYCVWLLIEVHSYGVARKIVFNAVFVIFKSKSKTVWCFTNINSVRALSTK